MKNLKCRRKLHRRLCGLKCRRNKSSNLIVKYNRKLWRRSRIKDRRYYQRNWFFPIKDFNGEIPIFPHLGAFAAERKFHTHEGVDLYAPEGTSIYPVEPGSIIAIDNFTGPLAGSPWWHDTMCVLVEGKSGVVVYGEITPNDLLRVGQQITPDIEIGKIKQVLIKDKGKPMSMLHLELHIPGTQESVEWARDQEKPESLLDPTWLLRMSIMR